MFVVRVARLLDGPVGDQPVEGSRFRLCDEVLVHELVHVEQFISCAGRPAARSVVPRRACEQLGRDHGPVRQVRTGGEEQDGCTAVRRGMR